MNDKENVVPALKDFSDVTFVCYDDEQDKAHTIILAWPDHSKIGRTASASPQYIAPLLSASASPQYIALLLIASASPQR